MLGALTRASEPNTCVCTCKPTEICVQNARMITITMFMLKTAPHTRPFTIFSFCFFSWMYTLFTQSFNNNNNKCSTKEYEYLCFALSYTMCSSLITGKIIIARRKKKLLFSIAEAIKIAWTTKGIFIWKFSRLRALWDEAKCAMTAANCNTNPKWYSWMKNLNCLPLRRRRSRCVLPSVYRRDLSVRLTQKLYIYWDVVVDTRWTFCSHFCALFISFTLQEKCGDTTFFLPICELT